MSVPLNDSGNETVTVTETWQAAVKSTAAYIVLFQTFLDVAEFLWFVVKAAAHLLELLHHMFRRADSKLFEK